MCVFQMNVFFIVNMYGCVEKTLDEQSDEISEKKHFYLIIRLI